jgi:hypothetical protein
MLRTPLCDLLRIDVPVLCAPFGPWDQVALAFAATLRARPAAISFHIGVLAELVERAHAEGILWISR